MLKRENNKCEKAVKVKTLCNILSGFYSFWIAAQDLVLTHMSGSSHDVNFSAKIVAYTQLQRV